MRKLYFKAAKNFVGFNKTGWNLIADNMEDQIEILSKRFRKIALDNTILEKEKIILPVLRIRQIEDTLASLRKSQLCSGKYNII